jgi:hypothetical protein
LRGRYELKFPIGQVERHAVLQSARPALTEDPHGQNAIYRVSSLYFDTADLSAYWEKIDGEAARRKFRLRYYSVDAGDEPAARTAFMEIKHRIDNTVFKERVRMTDEGANAVLRDATELRRLGEHVAGDDRRKLATIDAIERQASRPGFAAVVVVTYLREAWIGRRDRRLRWTFDSCCRAVVPAAYADVGIQAGTPFVADDRVIMEVKFDHAIPLWARDALMRHGIQLRRFSKYGEAVQALAGAGQLVHPASAML